jgi:hypothetical protein
MNTFIKNKWDEGEVKMINGINRRTDGKGFPQECHGGVWIKRDLYYCNIQRRKER